MKTSDKFEYTTPEDPSLNYCLWEYNTAKSSVDKFRSVNLLYQSYDFAGINSAAYDVVDRLRDGIGPFRTVFGIKLIEGKLGWEFYFYDYARKQREVSIGRVLETLKPIAPSRINANDNLEYFMFSLDIDEALATGQREIDVVHMYVGNPGSTVSSGIAYALRAQDSTLENLYCFFDAGTQLLQAADKIRCSAFFDDSRLSVDEVLIPELRRCHTICVANKRTHDCVYFSGVDVDQLLFFLEFLNYPLDIQDFVRDNKSMLDHLLFDVGMDYRLDGDRVEFLKSGYYGVF